MRNSFLFMNCLRRIGATMACLILLSSATLSTAFYIPGALPTYYKEGDPVNVWINSIRSTSVLFPKNYYSLPVCAPEKIKHERDSLGEIIWGDHQQSSLYTLFMLKNSSCMLLPNCDFSKTTERINTMRNYFTWIIEQGYRGFMNIDNLPIFNNGTPPQFDMCPHVLKKDQQNLFQRGYALGVPKVCTMNDTLINNHIHFVIKYNTKEELDEAGKAFKKYMVVGLNAIPFSVKHQNESECNENFRLTRSMIVPFGMKDIEKSILYWSYSVEWVPSDVVWATRWDEYFHSSLAGSSVSLHLTYMGASVLVVVMLAASVTAIILRLLYRDILRYNNMDPEEMQEETGWKLIHADVFRPPERAGLLSAMVGNGYQISSMVFGVVFLSLIGFLSPSRRGSLLLAIILLSVLMSFIGGYACGFLMRYLNCKAWKHVFFCGGAFPGVLCGTYMLTTIISRTQDSTTAVSFGIIMCILLLWLAVSLPLTVIGATFALEKEPLKNPLPTGRLAREIPTQPSMNSFWILFIVPPIFPLFTIIMELQFAMQALWAGQVYYVFSYFAIACVLWIVVTVLVTVSHLYYVLCYENHRWWWLAFMIPGGFGVHMFVYSVVFFFTQLSITSFTSMLLYFMYMGILSYAYGLMAGAVGLTTGIIFTRGIYSRVKVE